MKKAKKRYVLGTGRPAFYAEATITIGGKVEGTIKGPYSIGLLTKNGSRKKLGSGDMPGGNVRIVLELLD